MSQKKLPTDKEESLLKDASISGTQSRYIDASGKEFSAQEIVAGYQPKKPYRLYSLSEKVSSPEFGKVKK